jgi:uncharacterized protein YndB with AHSA1/START domain
MAQPPDEYTAAASIDIAAPPEQVYDLIADVARVGEFSPEATGARGASAAPTQGEKFWGFNKRGPWRWFTRCTVREAHRGRRFSFDVDFPPMPVSRWTYDIEPTDTGCRVTETWNDRREGPIAAPITWIGGIIIPGPRADHNQRNIETTLQRLKAAAEKKG